ncbi:MAG: hypothetical protein ACTTIC_00050 [Helicobacteraceae bacterium]
MDILEMAESAMKELGEMEFIEALISQPDKTVEEAVTDLYMDLYPEYENSELLEEYKRRTDDEY